MLELTAEIEKANSQEIKTPNLILEIDDIATRYSLVSSKRIARYGDGYDYGDDLYYGKITEDLTFETLIDLGGTTTNITQQIDPQEATNSIQSITIKLVDDGVSQNLNDVDVFAKKANVYLSFKDLEHPINSVKIFSGQINSISHDPSSVTLRIDNPEHLKTQELFPEYKDKLSTAMDTSVTVVGVETTDNFIHTQDSLTSYIRIDDEIMEVVGHGETSFTVVRAQRGTSAASHDADAEVSSLYNLSGNAIDLALKLMLSSDEGFTQEYTVESFNERYNSSVTNAIYFSVANIEKHLGLVSGDLLRCSGSTSNDGDYIIQSFGTLDDNHSYIVVDQTITTEAALGVCTFKSKYNVLPVGCSMLPSEVDVEQHERIKDSFLQNSPDLDFSIIESKKADEFINTELYRPVGVYPIPRKGSSSCGYTSPPLAVGGASFLDESNITNAKALSIVRTSKSNFFNNVIYRHEHSVIDDKFLSINQTISSSSFDRYRLGSQPFTVESYGLDGQTSTKNFIETTASRILDRYQYGAESLTVEVDYSTGFPIEAGDTVVLDGRNIYLFDSRTGRRDTFIRVMEVINKSMSIKNGTVSLELLDTAFQIIGRYATISPASKIVTGTSNLITVESLFDGSPDGEKWAGYVGFKVKARTDDFSTIISGEVVGYDAASPSQLVVELDSDPTDGMILEFDDYNNQIDAQKVLHANFTYSLNILAGITQTSFSLFSADAGKIKIGDYLIVRSNQSNVPPYYESSLIQVIEVDGTTITVEDMGFIPQPQDFVEGISFDDGGDPYIML